jgi:Domain of unknown function (DUF4879)
MSMFKTALAILCVMGFSSAMAGEPPLREIEASRELDTIVLRAQMVEQYEASKRAKDESIVPLAPAPPLTQLQNYAIRSANHPNWEYLSTSQFGTLYDHGGAWMDLVTYEYGYGHISVCKIAGFQLTAWRTDPIVSGSTVIGWIRYWNADGFQVGQWSYQNTSSNYPWNTMSDYIQVW